MGSPPTRPRTGPSRSGTSAGCLGIPRRYAHRSTRRGTRIDRSVLRTAAQAAPARSWRRRATTRVPRPALPPGPGRTTTSGARTSSPHAEHLGPKQLAAGAVHEQQVRVVAAAAPGRVHLVGPGECAREGSGIRVVPAPGAAPGVSPCSFRVVWACVRARSVVPRAARSSVDAHGIPVSCSRRAQSAFAPRRRRSRPRRRLPAAADCPPGTHTITFVNAAWKVARKREARGGVRRGVGGGDGRRSQPRATGAGRAVVSLFRGRAGSNVPRHRCCAVMTRLYPSPPDPC
jgi:hypothetical protein